jgi:hypothetical protein
MNSIEPGRKAASIRDLVIRQGSLFKEEKSQEFRNWTIPSQTFWLAAPATKESLTPFPEYTCIHFDSGACFDMHRVSLFSCSHNESL